MAEEHRPIIIRRKKVVQKHHGGSWKIALADFMTALMALFLVMWILSTGDEETRQSVAEYFRTPLVVAMAGGDRENSASSVIQGGGPDSTHSSGEQARIDYRMQTRPADVRRQFQNIQRQIERAIQADPVLRQLEAQMRLDLTREGLRIQMMDTEKRPMFEIGSPTVAPYMSRLLQTVAPILNSVDNALTISGHTDSIPYAGGYVGYSNWELSSDRANASRRELVAGGMDPNKLLSISGVADRIPLEGADPRDPMNRRITLILHTEQSAEFIRRQGLLPGDAEEFERLLEQDSEAELGEGGVSIDEEPQGFFL
ncbi:motility protein MotB [Aliidiomarina shirensis]|uniref:Motility protein MotB n=1 Tax=Aliidiomarina shirensis TaxID=1048642 RepID=A0A432WQJ7_9GAMM|nr:flagellar motor protein MotB [Aliidiomarina shirensis]RUO36038.1 motility protein MotB [Aliidiomarina shirensis]